MNHNHEHISELLEGWGVPQGRSFGCGYPIALRVQVSSHLHGVTWFALLNVLVHCGLQQISILPFGLPHPHDTFVCRLHKYRRLCRLHVGPHLLKDCDLRSLRMDIMKSDWSKVTVKTFIMLQKLNKMYNSFQQNIKQHNCFQHW